MRNKMAKNMVNIPYGILLLVGVVVCAAQPVPAQALSDAAPFSFNAGGGAVVAANSGAQLIVGYGKIQPAASSPTPAMLEFLRFRSSGILTLETAIPTAPLISSGRLHLRTTGAISTGAAFANPNNQSVTVSFFFTDQAGTTSGSGTFVIGSNAQNVFFFGQAPVSGAPSTGTFTFSATTPISVIGIRGRVNERGDFLLTPLPVTPLPFSSNGVVTIPIWGDGQGYTNQVILINPTDQSISGSIQFLLASGVPATLTANGVTNSSFAYTISAKSSVEFTTSNGSTFQTGSVRITPAAGASSPSGFSLLSYKPSTITLHEAVFLPGSATAFRLYVENDSALCRPSLSPIRPQTLWTSRSL